MGWASVYELVEAVFVWFVMKQKRCVTVLSHKPLHHCFILMDAVLKGLFLCFISCRLSAACFIKYSTRHVGKLLWADVGLMVGQLTVTYQCFSQCQHFWLRVWIYKPKAVLYLPLSVKALTPTNPGSFYFPARLGTGLSCLSIIRVVLTATTGLCVFACVTTQLLLTASKSHL